ncbi:MAG: TrmH family RNA methyltransferase [Candidatus Promineifilaceae bacterium]|nr:TrmH family RNA methyltransferase [Candidatus Promineifilaceae bacterium]
MELSWFEGRISVEAAILGRNRSVEVVYFNREKRDKNLGRLARLATAEKIPVKYEDDLFFAEHAQGKSHGGVLAEVGPRRYSELNELIRVGDVPFVCMLDGVEDPFNFGQAIRALYAAGAAGLVVRERNWLSAANVVARASAGASEFLPTAVVGSALEAADYFRNRGLTIACTARKYAVSIYDSDLIQPMFILVGGERRGVTRSFLDQADVRLRIPYGRNFAFSLGVTASTAILAFEILRQRTSH